MIKSLAEDIQIAPDAKGFKGIGNLGAANSDNGVASLSSLISKTIGVMTIVAIIWFVFLFIIGVIGIIGSGGDKQALESARKKITTGVIGLIVIVLALVLISLLGKFIGVSNILDIGSLFNLIK